MGDLQRMHKINEKKNKTILSRKNPPAPRKNLAPPFLRRHMWLRSASRDSHLLPMLTQLGGMSAAALPRRRFHSGLDDSRIQRLRRTSVQTNKPRGRDIQSEAFESRIDLKPLHSVGDLYRDVDAGTAVVLPVSSVQEVDAGSIPLPSACRFHYDNELFPTTHIAEAVGGPRYATYMRRFLRKDADTVCTSVAAADGGDSSGLLIMVVNPFLDVASYKLEEAEVEMITAYRNILAESSDWSMGTPLPSSSSSSSPSWSASTRPGTRRKRLLTRLRVPVLSIDTAGSRFEDRIPKLTQVSIIKAFHRVGNAAKEHLLYESSTHTESGADTPFRVELYVPPHLLQTFQQTFLTEAWAPKQSIVIPPRFELYPTLPPPQQLEVCEGWVGKRPELLEAIRTKGASLESNVQFTLDGRVIEDCDAQAQVNVFGGDQAVRQIVAGEAANAP